MQKVWSAGVDVVVGGDINMKTRTSSQVQYRTCWLSSHDFYTLFHTLSQTNASV